METKAKEIAMQFIFQKYPHDFRILKTLLIYENNMSQLVLQVDSKHKPITHQF